MNLLKKSVSVALSILMVSNFTFCRALEKTEKLPNNKEESSLTSYILAGAAGAVSVAALAFGAAYLFSGNNDSSNGYVNNSPYNYGNPGKHDYGNSGKNVSVNAKSGPVNIQNVPANIKAIHWKDNLCWWTSSVLFLYYSNDFRANLNKYIKEHEANNPALTLVLSDLQEIFKILDDCNGNVCQITCDEGKMYSYLQNLQNFCGVEIYGNDDERTSCEPNLNNGRSHTIFFLIISNSLGINLLDATHTDNNGHQYNIRLIQTKRHYYIYLQPRENNCQGITIGKSIYDNSAIELGNVNIEIMKNGITYCPVKN